MLFSGVHGGGGGSSRRRGGGPPAVSKQTIAMFKGPDGTFYLDDKGTVCTEFNPEKGIVQATNAMGLSMMLTRKVADTIDQQPE